MNDNEKIIVNVFFKEVIDKKFEDYDPKIISWERDQIKGLEAPLIYIFPQPGENIKEKRFFAVKDYEKALFYNKGKLVGILKGGIYELEKKARIKGTEIVYLDISLIDMPWGIPQTSGIPTKDGYVVGLHGDLKLKISDIKAFYNDIVAGNMRWTIRDLKDWIITLLLTALRDIFKNYQAKEIIIEDRERVVNLITSKITEDFLRYGLELETFNIVGIRPPPDTQNLFEQEKQKSKLKERIERDEMNDLIKEKEDIQRRINDLKDKIKEQQDLLLNDKLTQEEYEKKKSQIQVFIDEAQEELIKVNEKLSNK